MAFDVFLKIDGIPGESTDHKHKDWIELLSFSHGVSQPGAGDRSFGGSAGSQRVDHGNFSITKHLDKATPKINLDCCTGANHKEVKIEICRATGDKTKYMEYLMTDVLITSVQIGGAAKGSELPVEQVGFNYDKIQWTYTATDHKTGKPSGDVKGHWSTVENKGG